MKYSLLILAFLLFACYQGPELPPDQMDWGYALPGEVGMDESELKVIDDSLKGGAYQDARSLLIIKEEKIIYENYYDETFRSELRPIGLGTIIVTIALLGEMIQDGYISSLDSPVFNYMPDQNAFEVDPDKKKVTFRHLLNHTSGLGWNESIDYYARASNDFNKMKNTIDWTEYVLNQGLGADPGTRLVLNHGAGLIYTYAMQKALGDMDLEEYANEKLFEPMGIDEYRWDRDPAGTLDGAMGLRLKELDYAKIGQLFLQEGVWKRNRLINREWVYEMTGIQDEGREYFLGYGWTFFLRNVSDALDINPSDVLITPYQFGEFMFVIPKHEMVVVMHAENYPYFFFSPSTYLFINIYQTIEQPAIFTN